jgi:hypothetical protein
MEWIQLSQDRVRWPAAVKAVMELRVLAPLRNLVEFVLI